jgi:hypothetical protein
MPAPPPSSVGGSAAAFILPDMPQPPEE